MSTLATLYRDLTCAAAAAVISVLVSLSFVTSTAVPPGTHATRRARRGGAARPRLVRPA